MIIKKIIVQDKRRSAFDSRILAEYYVFISAKKIWRTII